MQEKIEIIIRRLINRQIFRGISKEKRIIGILLVLLTGFLLYQSLLATQLLRLKAIDFQFISQKRLLNFYSRLEGNTNVLISQAKEKEMNLARIKEKFVSEEELPNYFTNFRDIVKAHNLKIISLDFKPQEGVADLGGKSLKYFQRLPLDISLKGGYSNLMFLLYKLERGSPLFEIKAIHLKQESPDSYEILMDMKAAIYILVKKS